MGAWLVLRRACARAPSRVREGLSLRPHPAAPKPARAPPAPPPGSPTVHTRARRSLAGGAAGGVLAALTAVPLVLALRGALAWLGRLALGFARVRAGSGFQGFWGRGFQF